MKEKVHDENIFNHCQGVLSRLRGAPPLARVEAITPDASARRYYRLFFESTLPSGASTCVAMIFDSVACAEVGSGERVDSDRAYVELTGFLQSFGVAVPELLLDARDERTLLVEDVGEKLLADVLSAGEKSALIIEKLYEKSIDQIFTLQRIAPDTSLFAFHRGFTAELYRKEMGEFLEYIYVPKMSASNGLQLEKEFADFAEQLSRRRQVLVHRDFHCWNLIVDARGEIRVIDFQDALLGSPCYDVVSLLHDRDIDSLLGEERVRGLQQYFFDRAQLGESGEREYHEVLLQRDLKVAGRFAKLVGLGKPAYGKWILPTRKRIERTLGWLGSRGAYQKMSQLILRCPAAED